MKKLLTNYDIEQMTGVKSIRYDDLNQITNILDKLPLVVLYNTTPTYGHWTLVFRTNRDTIEFFDSLGFIPDTEMQIVGTKVSKNYKPTLMSLLFKTGKEIEYNNVKLQKSGKEINTCGRWVVHRYLNRNIPIEDYVDWFMQQKNKGIDLDELIVELTN